MGLGGPPAQREEEPGPGPPEGGSVPESGIGGRTPQARNAHPPDSRARTWASDAEAADPSRRGAPSARVGHAKEVAAHLDRTHAGDAGMHVGLARVAVPGVVRMLRQHLGPGAYELARGARHRRCRSRRAHRAGRPPGRGRPASGRERDRGTESGSAGTAAASQSGITSAKGKGRTLSAWPTKPPSASTARSVFRFAQRPPSVRTPATTGTRSPPARMPWGAGRRACSHGARGTDRSTRGRADLRPAASSSRSANACARDGHGSAEDRGPSRWTPFGCARPMRTVGAVRRAWSTSDRLAWPWEDGHEEEHESEDSDVHVASAYRLERECTDETDEQIEQSGAADLEALHEVDEGQREEGEPPRHDHGHRREAERESGGKRDRTRAPPRRSTVLASAAAAAARGSRRAPAEPRRARLRSRNLTEARGGGRDPPGRGQEEDQAREGAQHGATRTDAPRSRGGAEGA